MKVGTLTLQALYEELMAPSPECVFCLTGTHTLPGIVKPKPNGLR